jgi:hypothetical protein
MRTSTAVIIFGFAGVACATSDPIDPLALRGTQTFPFIDGASPNGGFGGDMGNGGVTGDGGFMGNGGAPMTGGFVGNGGNTPAKGGQSGGPPMGTGGAATGGAPPGTGGSVGGSAGAQGGAAGSCSAQEKVCNGTCVNFGPANGCSAPTCTACSTPAPQNGFQTCNGQGQCDFTCKSGFTKSGSNCVSTTGGDGGSGINCGGQTCTNSCPLSTQCCKSGGGCGCNIPILGCQ